MRQLLPEPTTAVHPDVDVHAHYAAGWTDTGGVRMDFVAAADGAVAVAGVSRGLQTPGDNVVFAAMRDLADVVLVGSGTAIAEGYGRVRFRGQRLAARRKYGLPDQLPIAVLSRSLRLDPDGPLFREPDGQDAGELPRSLVLTCTSAAGNRAALEQVADVIDCGTDTVEPAMARAALEARGLRRIICEGGPTVFAQFAAAGVVDELCLSVTPLLAGPGPGRITAGDSWPGAVRMSLTGLLEEDGALFCRYRTNP